MASRDDLENGTERTLSKEQRSQDTLASASVEQQDKPVQDVVPDGGYGWVVVACVFLINMHSWGLNSSYGVFLADFNKNHLFPNATILDYSFIAGMSIGCAFLLSPVATYTVKRFGTRVALIIGTCVESLALITASFTTEIWQLYLSQGVCFGFGMGFLYIASVGLIPQWFLKKRSFANAIGAAGSGLGGLCYNLAASAVIQRHGYPWAYRMVGICAFVVNMTCAFLARDRNKAVGARLQLWDSKLFSSFGYWMLQAWGIFSMFGYLVLVYTLPTYATSIGLTASQGSIIGAIFNLGQALGRPVVGLVSDRVGRLNIASVLTFLCGVLCLVWWIFAKSFGVLVAFALVVGTLSGTYWATIAPVGAEVVGLQDLPVALGMTWLILILPTVFTEVIALEIRTNTAFVYAQLYTGLCYIVAGLILWTVRVWKLGVVEQQAAEEKRQEALEQVDTSPSESSQNGQRGVLGDARTSALKRAVAWRRI